jgi:hypothetical protein
MRASHEREKRLATMTLPEVAESDLTGMSSSSSTGPPAAYKAKRCLKTVILTRPMADFSGPCASRVVPERVHQSGRHARRW